MIDFVAVDIELASSDPTSICEIAFCKFEGGVGTDVAHTLIKPKSGSAVSPQSSFIHGIVSSDLETAPHLGDVWPQLEDFIGNLPIVAHNATQDLKKIAQTLSEQGKSLGTHDYYCTLTLARNIPQITTDLNFELANLALELGVEWAETQRESGIIGHSAVLDANATGQIFVKELEFSGGDSMKLLESLDMQTGQIKDGVVTRGNAKKKKPSTFFSGDTLNAKDFDLLKDELLNAGFSPLSNHPLTGKNVVLTLTLETISEREFWICVALAGGQLKTGISKKVSLLVEGKDPTGRFISGQTSKSREAREINESSQGSILILNEPETLTYFGPEVMSSMRDFVGE